MGYKLVCSECKRVPEVGSPICLKGSMPSDQEWRAIFFKGIEGLGGHFKLICQDCQKNKAD